MRNSLKHGDICRILSQGSQLVRFVGMSTFADAEAAVVEEKLSNNETHSVVLSYHQLDDLMRVAI